MYEIIHLGHYMYYYMTSSVAKRPPPANRKKGKVRLIQQDADRLTSFTACVCSISFDIWKIRIIAGWTRQKLWRVVTVVLQTLHLLFQARADELLSSNMAK